MKKIYVYLNDVQKIEWALTGIYQTGLTISKESIIKQLPGLKRSRKGAYGLRVEITVPTKSSIIKRSHIFVGGPTPNSLPKKVRVREKIYYLPYKKGFTKEEFIIAAMHSAMNMMADDDYTETLN